MKQHRGLATLLALFGAGALFSGLFVVGLPGLAVGCNAKILGAPPGPSDADGGGAPPDGECDPAKCAPGNECLSDGKATKCRLVCEPSVDHTTGGQAACPTSYTCVGGNPKAFCVPDKVTYAKSDKGQWGAACPAPGGFDRNPACDSEQNFWCYGTSPFDGAAFCTQFDCADDSDCRGGWWCATKNTAPNVLTKDRSTGTTRRVCLPRTYCSTCATDVDCPPLKGIRQACVPDSLGGMFCSPECTVDSNCNNEARCAMAGGARVCVPLAGACKTDGALCAPCLSDADCPDGTCATSPYSTEHFCTVKSKVACTSNGMKLTASDCPKTNAAMVPVSCATTEGGPDPSIGKDQCFGLVKFGMGMSQGLVPGCFTPAR